MAELATPGKLAKAPDVRKDRVIKKPDVSTPSATEVEGTTIKTSALESV
jgi:hypothetical protein